MTQNGTDDVSHEIAVAALASGSTVKGAAKKAGVSRETLHRWMRDPAFKARVAAAAKVWGDDVHSRIQALAQSTCDAIALALRVPGERMTAAKLVLERLAPATQKHEVKTDGMSEQEIEARLAALGFERKGGT